MATFCWLPPEREPTGAGRQRLHRDGSATLRPRPPGQVQQAGRAGRGPAREPRDVDVEVDGALEDRPSERRSSGTSPMPASTASAREGNRARPSRRTLTAGAGAPRRRRLDQLGASGADQSSKTEDLAGVHVSDVSHEALSLRPRTSRTVAPCGGRPASAISRSRPTIARTSSAFMVGSPDDPLGHLPVLEHRDVVAQIGDLVEAVRHEDHGRALAARSRMIPCRRSPRRPRARPWARPSRSGARPASARDRSARAIGRPAEIVEVVAGRTACRAARRPRGPLPGRTPVDDADPGPGRASQRHVAQDVPPGIRLISWWMKARPSPVGASGVGDGDRRAVDLDRARVGGRLDPGQAPDQRGLPRAVGTDQPVDDAGTDVQGDVGERARHRRSC